LIIALFQRYYRELCLLLLALLGLSCGLLSATLLGTKWRGPALPTRAAAPLRPPSPAVPEADFAFILQHNLFNPAARSATPIAFSLQAGAGEGTAVRSDLELLGTVVAGSRSLALIRMGQELKNYHLDEELPGGRIEEIARHQVSIRNHDRSLTVLTLYEEGASRVGGASPSTVGTGAAPAASGSVGAARDQAPAPATVGAGLAADAVRSVGANRWIVSHSAAQAARENIGEQLRTALLQPNLVNGKTDGFVVKRIQPGTLLAQMGLQRGDVIKRVNRMPLDSPEKALQIMQQLREARQLSVDLERGGAPLSFTYEIE
jgi:general secretion pathway protein C